jgi:Mg2+ and Co2+ transporter CorA
MIGSEFDAIHYVKHLMSNATVSRDTVVTFIRTISPTIQSRIDRERERLNLSLEEHPITQTLHDLYQQTINHYFPFVPLDDDSNDSTDDDILDSPTDNHNVRQRTSTGTAASSNLTTVRQSTNGERSSTARFGTVHRGDGNQLNRGRQCFGGFVVNNVIQSNDHAMALMGLLHFAAGHERGLCGSLGHNNRARWVQENINVLFTPNGPLGRFHPVSAAVMQRNVGNAQEAAHVLWEHDHSNDASGAMHEDLPEWAHLFFQLFEDQQNQELQNAQSARVREKRRQVVASLTGRQAPLGCHDNGIVELTDTSTNDGALELRSRVIGNASEERLNANGGGDLPPPKLMEG